MILAGAVVAALPAASEVATAADAQAVNTTARLSPSQPSSATRALFDAIRVNDLEAVKASVGDGADILGTGGDGLTALDLALAQGNFDIARYLMNVRTAKRTELARRLAETPAPPETPARAEALAAPPPPPTLVAGMPSVTLPLPPPAPKVEPEPAPEPIKPAAVEPQPEPVKPAAAELEPEPAAAPAPAIAKSSPQPEPEVLPEPEALPDPEALPAEAKLAPPPAPDPEPAERITPPPPPAPTRYHVIRRGETLTGIAARYAVSPEDLMRLNGIDQADHILIGNRLALPASARELPQEPEKPKIATAESAPPPRPAPESMLAPPTPAAPDPTAATHYAPAAAPEPAAPEPTPKPEYATTIAPAKADTAAPEMIAAPAPPAKRPAEPPVAQMVTPPPPPVFRQPQASDTTDDVDAPAAGPDLFTVLSKLFAGSEDEPSPAKPDTTAAANEPQDLPPPDSGAALVPQPNSGPGAPPQTFAPPIVMAPARPVHLPPPPPMLTPRPAAPAPAAAPVELPDAPVVEQEVAVQKLPPAMPREGAPPPPPPPPPKPEAAKQKSEAAKAEEPSGFFTAMSKGFGNLFSAGETEKKAAEEKAKEDEFVVAPASPDEHIELRKDGTVSVAVNPIDSPLKPPAPTKSVEKATIPAASGRSVAPPMESRAINPFDPNNAPVGSTLPIVDPIAGDHPELGSVPIPKTLPRIEISDANRIETPSSVRVARLERRGGDAPEPRIRLRPVPKTSFDHEPSTLENLMELILPSGDVAAKPEIDAGNARTASRSPPPVTNVREPLTGVALTLGGMRPGDEKVPAADGDREACVRRPGKTVEFCIVVVDWPDAIAPAFSVNTILYQGTRAIVRYDGGRATHIHALFNASDHNAVVQYFLNKYGQETDVWQRTIAPFNKPREPNPTRIWRSLDPATNIATVLEVRRFDDTRSTFPDVRHGVVRLYSGDAKKLFPSVSTLDIMTIDWAARADIPEGDEPPAMANTLPAQR